MVHPKRATTADEAQAQEFDLPAFQHWRQFAALIDGYQVAEEMGLDYKVWYPAQKTHWETTGEWALDTLHLRLMLFFIYRSDYMTGYTYTEHDDIVDSLLHALSQQLGLFYEGCV